MNKQILIDTLCNKFPDVAASKLATRAQIMEVTSYIPAWLNNQKVGRGMYRIDGAPTAIEARTETAELPRPALTVESSFTAIPAVDPNFVPFGNYSDLERIIKAGIFYPVYITGPTGNGKSTMVEQICAKHKRPLIRVNLNMMSDEEQLIGSKTLENGDVKIVEGPVLIAMRNGITILLDECDAGSANTLLCLQPILEGKPYYFKLNNEVIIPRPGFNVIATANTKGKGSDDGRYIGTNVLNEAFLERFGVTFEQHYPDSKVEMKIVRNLMRTYDCMDDEFATSLVKWADAIRRTFDDGGVDENITTRRLTHIIRAYAIFRDRNKAIELCCNRFDMLTKTAFIDLFSKVSAEPASTSSPAEQLPEQTSSI